MLIGFKNYNLILQFERNENFIALQDAINEYVLCLRVRDNLCEIPYIALPHILRGCKKIGYRVKYDTSLLDNHTKIVRERKILETVKTANLDSLKKVPLFAKLLGAIESLEAQYGFTLTEGQKRSTLFCLLGKKVLIANEIGTGKTLTINTVCKYLISQNIIKKVIVLVPAALVKNYFNDYVKFFGEKGILAVREETPAKRRELYKIFQSTNSINFLVTNYEKCLFDYEQLKLFKPDVIIVDEFHRMKNFLGAKRSQNFFEMLKENWNAEYRFPMSGTPIENKLFDLFPIFKLLDGGKILGGQRFFENNFVQKKLFFFKIKYRGRWITKSEERAIGFKNLEYLKHLIRPRIIREKLLLPVGCYHEYIEIEPSKKLLDAYSQCRQSTSGTSAKYHACRQALCNTERIEIQDNPKLEQLDNILDQTSEQCVIFSFYLTSMDMLAKHLDAKGIKYLEISGRTTEDATKTIQKFEHDKTIKCLICTDKVNFGVTIVNARVCIELDMPLKPTIQEQRIGRLYRVGQLRDVHVYSMYVKNTVEEKIYTELISKKYLIKKAIVELDDKKLKEIEQEIENNVMREFT
jgi:SNF2 family DNA or RNA helicase